MEEMKEKAQEQDNRLRRLGQQINSFGMGANLSCTIPHPSSQLYSTHIQLILKPNICEVKHTDILMLLILKSTFFFFELLEF